MTLETRPLMECGCVATGIDLATNEPVCVSHVGIHPGATVVSTQKPSLNGRQAKCGAGCNIVVDSGWDLAFFVFKGDNSVRAREICKHCAYSIVAHMPEHMRRTVRGTTVIEQGKCNGFEAHGAYDYDEFYCGCRGWD